MNKTKNLYDKFYTYKITNTINGKIYIGETHSIDTRFKRHINSAKHGSNSYIHRAIRKYGSEYFIVEQLGEYLNEKDALNSEIEFIKQFQSNVPTIGYNLTTGGDKPSFSDSVREQMKIKSLELWNDQTFIINSIKGQTGLTVDDLTDMFALRKEGLLVKDIAILFNIHRSTVTRILLGKHWKNILPEEPLSKHKYTEEDVYNIRNLVNEGNNYIEISSLLSIPQTSVKRMAKGYGRYGSFAKVAPITRNIKLIDDEIVNSIKEDFQTNNFTFVELSKKHNLCTDTISDIVCATGRYSYLEPLTLKENKRKFSKKEVKNIRSSTQSITELSKLYNVDYKTIYNIIHFISYK